MYLLIDCTTKDVICLTLFSQESRVEYMAVGRNARLLHNIVIFLDQESVARSDILGIVVVVGGGSFSSTRIAATVANTWGFVQGVPVIGVPKDGVKDIEGCIKKLITTPYYIPLHPTYSGEPNIGKKKNT